MTPTLISSVSWEAAKRLVCLVPQYQTPSIVCLEQIPVGAIESTARFVRSVRLAFADSVLKQMQEAKIEPFSPVMVRCPEGKRIVVPPIVEEHDGRFFLLDGTHRIWAARHQGLSIVYVVHVSGLDLALPSKPFPWEQMIVREDHYSAEENLVDLDRALFRPATTTFNGPKSLVPD